jgi:hypothetical protein
VPTIGPCTVSFRDARRLDPTYRPITERRWRIIVGGSKPGTPFLGSRAMSSVLLRARASSPFPPTPRVCDRLELVAQGEVIALGSKAGPSPRDRSDN